MAAASTQTITKNAAEALVNGTGTFMPNRLVTRVTGKKTTVSTVRT